MSKEGSIKPFLKWAGGKRWFVQRHSDLLPKTFNRYIEPFLGGGSVFFYLQPKKSLLGDTNPDLIAAYRGIQQNWQPPSFAVLSHEFVRREVHRSPDLANPYGKRTNWGEKVYLKVDPGTYMVLNIPTGEYLDNVSMPTKEQLIGLHRIIATIPSIVSYKFEGALFPVYLLPVGELQFIHVRHERDQGLEIRHRVASKMPQ